MSRYPEYILEALDLSLVGCTLTMSVLSKEIDSLVESISDNTAAMSKGKRLKYIWKAESMDELLQQLRGQSSALSLLLKALDSSSIDQILAIVQSGKPTFQKVRSGAESIRRTHPEEHYAESIMDMSIDDNRTIYSLEISESTIEKGPVDSMASQLESTTLAPTTSSSLSGDGLPDGWKTGYSAKYDQWYVRRLNKCTASYEAQVFYQHGDAEIAVAEAYSSCFRFARCCVPNIYATSQPKTSIPKATIS